MYASLLRRCCVRGATTTTTTAATTAATTTAATTTAAAAAPPSMRIAHAALLRRRALQLGDYNAGYPSSLPLLGSAFASATPHRTNVYILAHGEAEGLARGERLERYGARIRLVRACAAGDARGDHSNHHDDNNDSNNDSSSYRNSYMDAAVLLPALDDITRQLNGMYAPRPRTRNSNHGDGDDNDVHSASNATRVVAAAAPAAVWRLRRVPCLDAAAATTAAAAADMTTLCSGGNGSAAAATSLHVCDVNSNAEVVVAEWCKCATAVDTTTAMTAAAAATVVAGDKGSEHTAAAAAARCHDDDDDNSSVSGGSSNELLMENGIGFSCLAASGLRVMRAARMAFLARVEALAASIADEQKYDAYGSRHRDEDDDADNRSGDNDYHHHNSSSSRGVSSGSSRRRSRRHDAHDDTRHADDAHTRTLSILDVSEVDYSCSHMVVQGMAEQGTLSQPRYQLTFVPLTHRAAQCAQLYADTQHRPRNDDDDDDDDDSSSRSRRHGGSSSNRNRNNGDDGKSNNSSSNSANTTATSMTTRFVMSHARGTALAQPFELLPLRSFDVGAFTAYIDLSLPSGRCIVSKNAFDDYHVDASAACANNNNDSSSKNNDTDRAASAQCGSGQTRGREWGSSRRGTAATTTAYEHTQQQQQQQQQQQRACRHLRRYVDARYARAARSDDVARLAMALATLRRGGAMLVTLLPTPVSAAALCEELRARRDVHVALEAALLRDAKALVAEAIRRTGRWSALTDEVLPTIDAPQGSAVSLMVVMD